MALRNLTHNTLRRLEKDLNTVDSIDSKLHIVTNFVAHIDFANIVNNQSPMDLLKKPHPSWNFHTYAPFVLPFGPSVYFWLVN